MSLVEAFSEFFNRIDIFSRPRFDPLRCSSTVVSFAVLSGAVMASFIIPRHMIGEGHKRCHETER